MLLEIFLGALSVVLLVLVVRAHSKLDDARNTIHLLEDYKPVVYAVYLAETKALNLYSAPVATGYGRQYKNYTSCEKAFKAGATEVSQIAAYVDTKGNYWQLPTQGVVKLEVEP